MPMHQGIAAALRTAVSRVEARLDGMSDAAIATVFTLIYLGWRILSLPLVEFAGDVVYKWRIFRYFHAFGVWFPVRPEHHSGRWAQNLPALGFIRLFDCDHPLVSMIVPILTGIGVLLLVYLISRRFAGKPAAALTVLAVMGTRTFINESAQLLPSLPAAFYTLLALELMLLHQENPRRSFLALLSGIAMGFAWGCKVTAAYWCVGIAIHLVTSAGNGRDLWKCRWFRIGYDLLLFSLGFLIVFGIETIVLNRVFGVSAGRLSLLFIHSGGNPHLVPLNLAEYLLSPLRFFLSVRGKGLDFVPKIAIFVLAVPTIWFTLKHEKTDPAKRLLAVALLIAALLHCYVVTRIFPFRHPERPLPRYYFTLFCVALILAIAQYPALLASLRGKWGRVVTALTGASFVLYAIFAFIALINDPLFNNDNLVNTIRSYRCEALQRREQFPLLIRYQRNGRKFTSRTAKLIITWRSLTGKLEELPELQIEPQEQFADEWEKIPPAETLDGERFFLLRGELPAPGTEVRCAVVDEQNVSLRKLRFKPAAAKQPVTPAPPPHSAAD